MRHYIFERDSNKFDDILKDSSLKTKISTVMTWRGHLMIGFDHIDDKLESYIVLKFGDDIRTQLTKDFAPKAGIDYIPRRN